MSIDWSKAPAGAQAGFAERPGLFGAWYKKGEDGRVLQICTDVGIHEWSGMGGRVDFPAGSEIRPANSYRRLADECAEVCAPQWDGSGIPPVGIEVEAMLQGLGNTTYFWQLAKVVYGPLKDSPGEVLVFSLETTRPAWLEISELRPIRTAEHIAAEERRKENKDLADQISGFHGGETTEADLQLAEYLYDHSYRKVIKTQHYDYESNFIREHVGIIHCGDGDAEAIKDMADLALGKKADK